jgi:hypothetical protein
MTLKSALGREITPDQIDTVVTLLKQGWTADDIENKILIGLCDWNHIDATDLIEEALSRL